NPVRTASAGSTICRGARSRMERGAVNSIEQRVTTLECGQLAPVLWRRITDAQLYTATLRSQSLIQGDDDSGAAGQTLARQLTLPCRPDALCTRSWWDLAYAICCSIVASSGNSFSMS